MNDRPDSLTRISKPLRCTSLHHTFLAASPSGRSPSLTCDSPLNSSNLDSDIDELSHSNSSSEDESMYSYAGTPDDVRLEGSNYLESRRHNTSEKKHRRTSSSTGSIFKHKVLQVSHASSITAAHAINEVQNRRDNHANTSRADHPTDLDRASFLAELPGAIARARKVHYQRDALLPKTKSFNRVQNSLKEDSAPVEADVKKEATLAKILKEKLGSPQQAEVPAIARVLYSGDSPQRLAEAVTFTETNSDIRESIARRLSENLGCEREDTLFTMEDINTCSPKSLTSPGRNVGTDSGCTSDNRHMRANQSRGLRPAKRKNDEGRYEPYTMPVNKRRAVSPSPGSPLGSPMKGSIFRIEDLSL